MDGAIAVATLTGASGGKIVGGITTMAGAATAGVEIAGTTAGVGTAGGQVTDARGATVTLAGGIIATIVADGTDGTITVAGILDPTIDGEVIGHATCAGGETNRFQRLTEPSGDRGSQPAPV